MKITASTTLPVDIDTAWEMLHTPAVFRSVSSPFTIFREDPNHPLPERFTPNTDYTVSVFAGGLVQLGTQIIHLEDTVESWAGRQTVDCGRGLTGLLSFLRNWRHQMSLQALPNGHTRFDDQLTVNASWLTPVMWPAFTVFWAWRAMSLRGLAKKRRSPLQDTWDSRYLARGQLWSGRVNPSVETVAGPLAPGRALDLGCGEGADALWLAEKGWQVDAVDASAVAVFRGHQEAFRRSTLSGSPVDISWQVADLIDITFPPGAFDLVSLQFIHLPDPTRGKLWQAAIDAVAPGGTLLIVGHSVSDNERGIPRPPEPLLFTPSDLNSCRPTGWASWDVSEVERSTQSDAGAITVTDVVLVGRR